MSKLGKKQTSPAPTTPLPKQADDTLCLTILDARYIIHRVRASTVPGDSPSFDRTVWTYHVTHTDSDRALVIVVTVSATEGESIIVPDINAVCPVTCAGVPDVELGTALNGNTPADFQLSRAKVTFSNGTMFWPQQGCDISLRPPTTEERLRYWKTGAISPAVVAGAALLNTSCTDAAARLRDVNIAMTAEGITRDGCIAVVRAMADMNAMSLETAQIESDILKRAGRKSGTINGLFSDQSGEANNYSTFRTRHIKSTHRRDKKYYFQLAQTAAPPRAPSKARTTV